MDEIGRTYLTLALSLNRHLEGFVDAYYGPPELQAEAQAGEPRRLDDLADDASRLQQAIEESNYDPQRKAFLAGQTRAMVAVIRNLSGDRLDFVEEVELYFDITPEMVDEAVLEKIHVEIDGLLPGDGPVSERMTAWRKRVKLEPDRILPVYELAFQETRRRTLALFDLPPGEEVSLNLVQDKPWTAYNWYLGRYRSRIDVNADLPMPSVRALRMVTHEGYAGHHTEHAIKEYHLYSQEGRAEHAAHLLLAPEAVLSEGIAESALGMIFSHADLVAFLRDELYPLADVTGTDVERDIGVVEAWERLVRAVGGNAALLLHRKGRSPDKVQQYIDRYALRTAEETAKAMRFVQNPLFRSYIFNYVAGKRLLAPLLDGPDATANFRRLLSEPLTQSQVRQWLAERGASPPTAHLTPRGG